MEKFRRLDKYDAHAPKAQGFVHQNYTVSYEFDRFHLDTAYAMKDRYTPGFTMGVNNKLHKASGRGYYVDGMYIGKND